MTALRALRFLVVGAALCGLLACVWLFGGGAYGARREREAAQLLEKTFGPRAALVAKYAAAETNAEAREAERLARAVGYDLSPKARGSRRGSGAGFSKKERAAILDYIAAQLVRPDEAVSAPPPEAAATLEAHRAALTAFEGFLASAPPPRWGCDPAAPVGENSVPNLLGHIQTQRLLVADALAAAARGDSAVAVRALEASWKLNEALFVRPETLSQLVAVAVARSQAAALRKVSASSELWGPRLAAMGRRGPLVDALVLEHGNPIDFIGRARNLERSAGGGGNRFLGWLQEPRVRVWGAGYSEDWARAVAELRDAPAFEAPRKDAENPRGFSEIMLSIQMPNFRDSFERTDRLALDAELTGKVLRAKAARAATGAWPSPSPEIAASRFPGLAWNYRVDGNVMAIALNRELPKPKAGLVLPTSFSSRAPAP